MEKLAFFCFVACLNPAGFAQARTSMSLELVQVIFRHGERTPLKGAYDVYNYTDLSLYEPYGLEQLTNHGKNQVYDLGRMLRDRYASFLDPEFNSTLVYARSSDRDRTKATLQLVLAGLYPPTPELTWNADLKWSPIPFHLVPSKLDVLYDSYKTAKFKKMVDRVLRDSPEFDERLSNHSAFFDFLREKTGVRIERNGYRTVGKIYKVLFINERLNLPLPDWYTPEVKRTLAAIAPSFGLYSYTPEMRRLNGGTFVRKFLENMNVDGGKKNPRKLYLYSGSDVKIDAIQRSLGLRDVRYPDFASALVFEKHRDSQDRLYVRILFYSTIERRMSTLRLDGCEEYCRVDEYARMVDGVMPTDAELSELLSDFDLNKLVELSFEDALAQ